MSYSYISEPEAKIAWLSAELADARAQLATVVGQLQQCIDERNHRIGERVAAERALEAVRAEVNATIKAYWDGNVPNEREFVRRLDAALSAASPTTSDDEEPSGPEPAMKPCRDCGHDVSVHHKLRCEAPEVNCYGCNGWTCPEHGLTLCGCTYLGGPEPAASDEPARCPEMLHCHQESGHEGPHKAVAVSDSLHEWCTASGFSSDAMDWSPAGRDLVEDGRKLASEREGLIVAGADPSDLIVPLAAPPSDEPARCERCEGTGIGYGQVPSGQWMETDCSDCDGSGHTEPSAASDEPARCPHGHTESHWMPGGDPAYCPGPAASGSP